MNKPAILGALVLGVAGFGAASCSGKKDSSGTTSTGGQSAATGGSGASAGSGTSGSGTSGGGAATGGTATTGGAPTTGGVATGGTVPFACGHADASVQFNEEGGLSRIGYTDPTNSIVLADGSHYVMPNSKYKGYCWTYDDAAGSDIYPPCGGPDSDGGYPPCFTASTGLCVSASLGMGSANTWGAGFGCNLNQAAGSGTADLLTDVIGMTSITFVVYGCAVPTGTERIQIQLNVPDAPYDDAGVKGSGRFCKRTALGTPDANGMYSVTVQIADLRQDCWNPGGLAFDAATMYVKAVQAQINAPEESATNWDFCVSRWTIQ